MGSSTTRFRTTLVALLTLTFHHPKSNNSSLRNPARPRRKLNLPARNAWPVLKRFEKASMTTMVFLPHRQLQILPPVSNNPATKPWPNCCRPTPSGTSCRITRTFKTANSTSMHFAVSCGPKLNVPSLVSSSPLARLILHLPNYLVNLADAQHWCGLRNTLTRL